MTTVTHTIKHFSEIYKRTLSFTTYKESREKKNVYYKIITERMYICKTLDLSGERYKKMAVISHVDFNTNGLGCIMCV